jgi:FkbM family methyltransferase
MLMKFRRFAGRLKRQLLLSLPDPSPADDIAELFRGRPAVLVKVGSNDGVQGDPLRKLIQENNQWLVLFIEPVKAIYVRLMQNYSGSAYRFENVAIADQSGTRPFYYVSDAIKAAIPDVPFWYDQLGSFDRNHIIKLDRTFEPFIIMEEVPCDTLAGVLEKHGLTSLTDLIHIDTEGYDYEILKQIDLSARGPKAILYEHKHLTHADKAAAEALVLAGGYKLKRFASDTLAVRVSTLFVG